MSPRDDREHEQTETVEPAPATQVVTGALVELTGAAQLAGVLDHPHSPYFAAPDVYHLQPTASLHLICRFTTKQQETNYTCGCACVWMVLNHFGESSFDERTIAEATGTSPTEGSDVLGIKRFFDELGWPVSYHAGFDLAFTSLEALEAFLVDHLDAGVPIMVDWLDWGGHWQVVIGLDTMGTDSPLDDVLIMADPYDVTDHAQDGYYLVPLARFFRMWREGMGSAGRPVYQQPFLVATPPRQGA